MATTLVLFTKSLSGDKVSINNSYGRCCSSGGITDCLGMIERNGSVIAVLQDTPATAQIRTAIHPSHLYRNVGPIIVGKLMYQCRLARAFTANNRHRFGIVAAYLWVQRRPVGDRIMCNSVRIKFRLQWRRDYWHD